MKPALLIIDMQKEFLTHGPFKPSVQSTCEYINHIANFFRKKSYPVFLIHDQESVKPGNPNFEFVDQIIKNKTDETIHKMYGDSFRDTELESRLKDLGIDFLLIAGFRAEGCVLATIHGAQNRDIPFAVLRDGILSNTEDGAKFVEKTFPIMSYSVVEALL